MIKFFARGGVRGTTSNYTLTLDEVDISRSISKVSIKQYDLNGRERADLLLSKIPMHPKDTLAEAIGNICAI